MPRNSIIVSTKQQRIAELAKQSPQMAFTSLAYLVDIDWLKEAYRRTRKDGAVGVDGVTAAEYERELEDNLHRLLDPAHGVVIGDGKEINGAGLDLGHHAIRRPATIRGGSVNVQIGAHITWLPG